MTDGGSEVIVPVVDILDVSYFTAPAQISSIPVAEVDVDKILPLSFACEGIDPFQIDDTTCKAIMLVFFAYQPRPTIAEITVFQPQCYIALLHQVGEIDCRFANGTEGVDSKRAMICSKLDNLASDRCRVQKEAEHQFMNVITAPLPRLPIPGFKEI